MKCKIGDLAVVLESALGVSVGRIVRVVSFQGTHSEHGPIWRCASPNVVTEYGGVGESADFADAWLQPIRADGLNDETLITKELENV